MLSYKEDVTENTPMQAILLQQTKTVVYVKREQQYELFFLDNRSK